MNLNCTIIIGFMCTMSVRSCMQRHNLKLVVLIFIVDCSPDRIGKSNFTGCLYFDFVRALFGDVRVNGSIVVDFRTSMLLVSVCMKVGSRYLNEPLITIPLLNWMKTNMQCRHSSYLLKRQT